MAKKVVGVYNTELEVIEAVNNLKVSGYAPEEITIVAKNSDESAWIRRESNMETPNSDDLSLESDRNKEDESFWDKVKNFFVSESETYDETDGYTARFNQYGLTNEDAERYNAEVETGKVVVLAPENYSAGRMDTAANGLAADVERNQERNMQLREEELDIDKREVSAGEAQIRKEVHEDTKQIDVPVTREEIYVERKPVNREETAGTASEMKDETIRVPLKEEEVEVRKRPVVREEVEIGKKKVQETEEVFDTVKREELDVGMESNKDVPSYSRELDAAYLEDEDEEERLARRARINSLLNDEDDRL